MGAIAGSQEGCVYFVGAGPGDPGLLTLRAAELLRRATIVFHDRLGTARALELAAPGAEIVDVGKGPTAGVALLPAFGPSCYFAVQDEVVWL